LKQENSLHKQKAEKVSPHSVLNIAENVINMDTMKKKSQINHHPITFDLYGNSPGYIPSLKKSRKRGWT
jgi:hypothetical protein